MTFWNIIWKDGDGLSQATQTESSIHPKLLLGTVVILWWGHKSFLVIRLRESTCLIAYDWVYGWGGVSDVWVYMRKYAAKSSVRTIGDLRLRHLFAQLITSNVYFGVRFCFSSMSRNTEAEQISSFPFQRGYKMSLVQGESTAVKDLEEIVQQYCFRLDQLQDISLR